MGTAVYGEFPVSSWSKDLYQDLVEATRVRLATGFLDSEGTRELAAKVPKTAEIDVLFAIPGCTCLDVQQLLSGAKARVRGSRNPYFHWKLVLIEKGSQRIVWLGSANLTGKGLGGSGELMARLEGNSLGEKAWKEFVTSFDVAFQPGCTYEGEALRQALLAQPPFAQAQADADDAARGATGDWMQAELTKAAWKAERGWLAVWHRDLSERESREVERQLGPLPMGWDSGTLAETKNPGIKVGDMMFVQAEYADEYVFGRVAVLSPVRLGRASSLVVCLEVRRYVHQMDDADIFLPFAVEARKHANGRETRQLAPASYRRLLGLMGLSAAELPPRPAN